MFPSIEDFMVAGFRDAPVPLLVLRYRRIVAANNAVCDLFGHLPGTLETKSIRCLYPTIGDFSRTGEVWLRLLSRQGEHEDERFMQRADGQLFWVRVKGRTLDRADPFALTVWYFQYIGEARAGMDALSLREREVALYVMSGRTSRQIAQMLGISIRTVEGHRLRAMHKLGVARLADFLLLKDKFIDAAR